MSLANELRIGNWVEMEYSKEVRYTTIQPSCFSVNIDKFYLPIPLDEDWLQKFGFESNYKEFDEKDFPLLKYLDDDGMSIEPKYYIPIIPMILVNGSEGIGTGYSTKIPCYDPKQIIGNLRNKLLKGKEFEDMDPFWYGFEGVIAKVDNYNYEMYGTYQIDNDKLIITELPVGESIDGYKEFLEKLLDPEEKKVITKEIECFW
jgi:hypothetical protein